MNLLHDLQHLVYRGIVGEESVVLPGVVGKPPRAAAGLDVYRNNARLTFRRTLALTFPVVARLVGEECLAGLAHAFMQEYPSRQGDLGRYGSEFPTFLDVLYRDTTFSWLSDVARLEWAIAEAESEPDQPSVSVSALAKVPPRHCPKLRFRCQPGVRLLSSRHPIFAIWQANRCAEVPPVELHSGGEHVIVYRCDAEVSCEKLDRGTFAFAATLADGETLGEAFDAGIAADPGFDASAALSALVSRGILSEFSLTNFERYSP